MRWRAWYADGHSVASCESSWSDLPRQGLVILKVWPDEGSKRIACGHDAIWWDGRDPEAIAVLDLPQPFGEVARIQAAAGLLKFGALIDDERYAELYERALVAQE